MESINDKKTRQQIISAGWTPVFKILAPLFSVAVSVLLLELLPFYESYIDGWIVGFIAACATVFFCWYSAKLKQVRIDDDNLYVAGFFKEISIPLTGIASVIDFRSGSPVIVRLKEKSEFGGTILFNAKWRFLLPWESHPITEELTLRIPVIVSSDSGANVSTDSGAS